MIEEAGTVVAVESGVAWVEVERRTACGGCATRDGCGASALAKLSANARTRVRVEDTLGVAVGDRVVIGIVAGALLRASFLVYGLPLLAMGTAAVGSAAIGLSDGLCALVGLSGLAIGFVLARRSAGLAEKSRYAPVLRRRQDGQPHTASRHATHG